MASAAQLKQRIRPTALFWILLSLITLSGCGAQDKADIHALLDARDQAVSHHDIKAYHLLLMPGYDDHGQSEFEIVNRMRKLFAQFEQIEMHSDNRIVRLLDSEHAECEQSYLLRVKADGGWRQLQQRERILLTRTDDGWKISGGL